MSLSASMQGRSEPQEIEISAPAENLASMKAIVNFFIMCGVSQLGKR